MSSCPELFGCKLSFEKSLDGRCRERESTQMFRELLKQWLKQWVKGSYFRVERWSDVPASRAVNENQILSDFSCQRRGDVASNFPRRLVLAFGLYRFRRLETRRLIIQLYWIVWYIFGVIEICHDENNVI